MTSHSVQPGELSDFGIVVFLTLIVLPVETHGERGPPDLLEQGHRWEGRTRKKRPPVVVVVHWHVRGWVV